MAARLRECFDVCLGVCGVRVGVFRSFFFFFFCRSKKSKVNQIFQHIPRTQKDSNLAIYLKKKKSFFKSYFIKKEK